MRNRSVVLFVLCCLALSGVHAQDTPAAESGKLPDTALTVFTLRIDSEKDWAKISGLKQLTQLTIDCKNISSLSSELKKRDKLVFLWLINTQKLDVVQAFNILSGCPALDHLTIENIVWPKNAAAVPFPRGLKKMEFWNGNIPVFPPAVCGLPELKSLRIRNCKLKSVPAEIARLEKLQELDLSFNPVEVLPAGVWHLTQLRSFATSTPLPPEAGMLIHLEELSLYGERIRALPAETVHLASLERLYISCSEMDTFPAEILSLKKLVALSVSVKKVTSIPAGLAQLPGLRYLTLDLGFVRLEQPLVLKGLDQLLELTLNGIALDSVFSGLSSLTQLRAVDLSFCSLSEFPEELSQLTHLQKLNLSGNHLMAVAETIEKLTELEELTLSGNKSLEALPVSVCKLSRLEKLDLRNTAVVLPSCLDQLQKGKLRITR